MVKNYKTHEELKAGYILFGDIVDFSKRKINKQVETINKLEEIALSCS